MAAYSSRTRVGNWQEEMAKEEVGFLPRPPLYQLPGLSSHHRDRPTC